MRHISATTNMATLFMIKDLLFELETKEEDGKKFELIRLLKVSAAGSRTLRLSGKIKWKVGIKCYCVMAENFCIYDPNNDELMLTKLE